MKTSWFKKYMKYKKKYEMVSNKNIQQGGSMCPNACAPGYKYDNLNNTCMNVNDYNVLARKKGLSKEKDVSILIEKLKPHYKNTVCGEDNQECWFDLDHVRASLEKLKPLDKNTQNEWLNSRDIDRIMIQYQKKYPRFKYLGTHPMDFQNLYSEFRNFKLNRYKKYSNLGMVLNLDKSHQGGSHWVALFIDNKNKKIEYFDSYAQSNRNTPREVSEFANKIINEQRRYNEKYNFDTNTIVYQRGNSECGVFSVLWLLERIQGKYLKRNVNDYYATKMRSQGKDGKQPLFRKPSRAGRTKTLIEHWPNA